MKAQESMKKFADRRGSERSFKVGDLILLKIHLYKQSSIRGNAPQKLAVRNYGPYPVIAKVGSVAYRFQLPLEAKVHDTFHVSLLKKYSGVSPPISSQLPTF